MLSSDLKAKIKWLWDRFWAAGLSNPITAIEQISYLLFMRRLEYVDNGRLIKNKKEIKWSYYTKVFRLSSHEQKKFEKDKELLSQKIQDKYQELFKHIKETVFPFIKNLNDPHEPFTRAMESAVFLIDKPSFLREAMETIDDIYNDIFGGNNNLMQEILVTSHSPFIISDCKKDKVKWFQKDGNSTKIIPLDFETYGASIDYLHKRLFNRELIPKDAFKKLQKLVDKGSLEELRRGIEEFGNPVKSNSYLEKFMRKPILKIIVNGL